MKGRIFRLCTCFTQNCPADDVDIVQCGEGKQVITFLKTVSPRGENCSLPLARKMMSVPTGKPRLTICLPDAVKREEDHSVQSVRALRPLRRFDFHAKTGPAGNVGPRGQASPATNGIEVPCRRADAITMKSKVEEHMSLGFRQGNVASTMGAAPGSHDEMIELLVLLHHPREERGYTATGRAMKIRTNEMMMPGRRPARIPRMEDDKPMRGRVICISQAMPS